jgi:hypothetical protein
MWAFFCKSTCEAHHCKSERNCNIYTAAYDLLEDVNGA